MLLYLIALPVIAIGLLFYLRFGQQLILASRLPGPPGWPLIGNTLMFINKSPPEFLRILFKLKEDYGNLLRVWVGPELHVLVTDPKDVEVILNSTSHIRKSDVYNVLKPWLGNGLLISDGKKWQGRRKMITPTFHFKILERFVEIFDQQGNVFVQTIAKYAPNQKVQLYPLVTLCALDVICESAMGASINAQVEKDSEYVQAVKTIAHIVHLRMYDFTMRYDFSFCIRSAARSYEKAIKLLHDFTNNVIKKRREELQQVTNGLSSSTIEEESMGIKTKMAFLDLLLLAKTETGEHLTDAEIREEVDTFTFEGHDTTTSAITFCLYCIARYPDVQQKCFDEIVEVMGSDTAKPYSLTDLNKLSYLELVIKETLRLFPSVPLFGRQLSEELNLNGKIIPANTSLIISAIMMGRDPEIFPEPNRFNPERFAVDRTTKDLNPFAYVPFSAGPRNCIGQKFAMLEMKSLLSKVVRNFSLSLDKDSIMDPILCAELILRPHNDLNFYVTPRK